MNPPTWRRKFVLWRNASSRPRSAYGNWRGNHHKPLARKALRKEADILKRTIQEDEEDDTRINEKSEPEASATGRWLPGLPR